MAWTMPPEWAKHERTWMAWPCAPLMQWYPRRREAAYKAWAAVARAVSTFDPVTMVCAPGDGESARSYLPDDVQIVEIPIADSWMRDSGPTFVIDDSGALGGVDWTFNSWGGRRAHLDACDALLARKVCTLAGAQRLASKLVNEGGAIHVDGEGTVLLTQSVQMNINRNPSWTKEEVEREIHRCLGTSKAIWAPRGLIADTGDDGTDGHIDTLACFLKPGVIAYHDQRDPAHPDFTLSQELKALFSNETDAAGRPLELVPLPAPECSMRDGTPEPYTYVNFSFTNGGLVLCGYDDPHDAIIVDLFARLFPKRRIIQVDARDIFAAGGGVHCITQHQPTV